MTLNNNELPLTTIIQKNTAIRCAATGINERFEWNQYLFSFFLYVDNLQAINYCIK